MGKKGNNKGGQKGNNSIKMKPNKNIFKAKYTGKAKQRKPQSQTKAVNSGLKKMCDSAKTIAMLNADHNTVISTPTLKPKAAPTPSVSIPKQPAQAAPDVGGVTDILANF